MLYFGGHDGEPLAGLARAGGLDGGVQGQQIGLAGDVADQLGDGADFVRGAQQFLDHAFGMARLLDGGTGHPGRLAETGGDVGHRNLQLLGRRRHHAGLTAGLLGGGGQGLGGAAHGLGLLGDRFDRALDIGFEGLGQLGVLLLAMRQVGGELHHLVGPAVGIEDRIVGGLDPDRLAALAETMELPGLEVSVMQAGPEFPIFRAVPIGGIDEHRMMTADHLVETIARHREEILIGGEDDPVEVELDHRLRTADRVDLALHLDGGDLLRRDVGRQLDHAHGAAPRVQDGIVGGFEPDLAAALGQALELRGGEVATAQLLPEGAVIGRVAIGRVDEHRMMAPDDLVEPIAHGGEKILIGRDDGTIHLEFNYGERTMQCIQPSLRADGKFLNHKCNPALKYAVQLEIF